MFKYLRERRRYWASRPHKTRNVLISAAASVFVVCLSYMKLRQVHGTDRYWELGAIIVVMVAWLRYGYDKLKRGSRSTLSKHT